MESAARIELMSWLVGEGLTGLPENDLIRGFCERCRAGGIDLSRGLVFIDTLHPIFEGRGFRWTDKASNESDKFEYGSTEVGEAATNWRRSVFFHMLEEGHDEFHLDLSDPDLESRFSMVGNLIEGGHRHGAAHLGELDASVGRVVDEGVLGEALDRRGGRAGADAEGNGQVAGVGHGHAGGEAVDRLQRFPLRF